MAWDVRAGWSEGAGEGAYRVGVHGAEEGEQGAVAVEEEGGAAEAEQQRGEHPPRQHRRPKREQRRQQCRPTLQHVKGSLGRSGCAALSPQLHTQRAPLEAGGRGAEAGHPQLAVRQRALVAALAQDAAAEAVRAVQAQLAARHALAFEKDAVIEDWRRGWQPVAPHRLRAVEPCVELGSKRKRQARQLRCHCRRLGERELRAEVELSEGCGRQHEPHCRSSSSSPPGEPRGSTKVRQDSVRGASSGGSGGV